MSGMAINRIQSYEEILELDHVSIRRVVAETFFQDFVQEWKSTGVIPKNLLRESSVASSNLKVCMYICMYVWSIVLTVLKFFLLHRFVATCKYRKALT